LDWGENSMSQAKEAHPKVRKWKRMRAVDRRRQILEAAQHVFAEQNYDTATMAKIATAAGITEPTIYMHFRSKKDLFIAVLEESYAYIMEIIKQLWGKQGDLYTRYRSAIKELYNLIDDETHTGIAKLWIIAATVNDPEIASYVVRFDKDLLAFVSKDMKKAVQTEKITLKYNPEVFARIFISLIINSTTLILTGSKISKRELDGVLDLLLDSILQRSE